MSVLGRVTLGLACLTMAGAAAHSRSYSSMIRLSGVYIPRDLGECLVELDKRLPAVTRAEMAALPDRHAMVQYHHGLGTSLRNTWGLWGGSRLQQYFVDRGITIPDDMSGIVLESYYDWLKGDKKVSSSWESQHSRRSGTAAH